MVKIETFSRWMAEDARYMAPYCVEPYIWISITQPAVFSDDRVPTPVQNEWCRGICRVYFHDIVHPLDACILFNEEHAQTIVDFVKARSDDVSLICVHCEAGVSRSAAVSRSLGLWLNQKDPLNYEIHWPNAHVKHVMTNVIGGK